MPAAPVSWRWRIGLVVAGGLLVLFDLGLRFLSYRRLCQVLLLTSPTPDPMRSALPHAQSFGRLVNRAAQRLPWITCLRRSLVTWWLMRWSGLPSDVHIGVRLGGSNTSHSWVEHHGQVINDVPDIAQRYPIQFSDILDPSQLAQR